MMDLLVEIEDEVLLRLLLLAKRNGRALNEEILDILRKEIKDELVDLIYLVRCSTRIAPATAN